jgi:hypothetical protein
VAIGLGARTSGVSALFELAFRGSVVEVRPIVDLV